MDNQIIRFHNALQCLSCICDLAACISQDADIIDAAQAIRLIADLFYIAVMSCMGAQVKAELRAEGQASGGPPRAPANVVMSRNAQPAALPVARPVGGQPMAVAQPVIAQPVYAQPYPGQPTVAVAQPMPQGMYR